MPAHRLAILLALLVPAPALASMTIIGEDGTQARACFEATETRDIERGLGHCDAAIDAGTLTLPNLVATHVNRAILKTWAKHYGAALDDLHRALALRPGLPEAYANRANVYLMKGRYAAAISDFTRAIEGNCPKLFVVYYGRALAYERMDRIAEAIADFRAALALNPAFEEAREALVFYRALA